MLGIVVGVMMVAYVAVPSRLIGAKPTRSRPDKLAATAVGGALGVVVAAPSYVFGRVGLLMLGSPVLLLVGVVLICVAVVLQLGTTGAVTVVKMSAKLLDSPAGQLAPSQDAPAQ